MKTRSVELVAAPPEAHWVGDGFRVHNFIPGVYHLEMERMSPFIMLDYNSKHTFPATETPKGVGVHPHRGFETVTIAYKGRVQHHDSHGGGGVIGEGDVQWMTAASGVLHKEYHEKEWSKKGGEFQMVQLWVNLPAKYKMSTPKYQTIRNEDIGRIIIDDAGSEIEVIAGNYNDIKGMASTFTPIHIFNVKLKRDSEAPLNFPASYNTALLVIEGQITINGSEAVGTDHLALMANDGEDFMVTATTDALVMVLSGEPINEPIAAHGPFVMNTRRELMQAFDDFGKGKFGVLEE